MKTGAINQKIIFKASPGEVYGALMDSKKHSMFTGAEAVISSSLGGKFTAYDGWIEGENLELQKDNKIVQKWCGADWPKGHYSIVTLKLRETKNGTELSFNQTGVPREHYKEIDKGWVEHYWKKLKRMIEE